MNIEKHSVSDNNRRIAKNTLFLYIRMIVIMFVSLYTSRVILQSLGVENYGIYNLVGGIAAMFNVILNSLTDATQRFITYEIGKINGEINKVFSTSILLHIALGILFIIIVEPIGLWFLYNKLIIPENRLFAASCVFHCSVISVFIMIISVPYYAIIIAYEKMKTFAYISVIDAIMRLLIAYILFINIRVDKLIIYAILMLLTHLLLRLIYSVYCKKKIKEVKFQYFIDKPLINKIGKFASWTIFGNASFIFYTQGINLLLGMFFLPAVNAARGISTQVQGAIQSFVRNFQTAVNPQITKTYANNELSQMRNLIFKSSKFSFFLMLFPALPILFCTKELLIIWLGIVPDYTTEFVQLTVAITMFSCLIFPLEISVKATGKIKIFELLVYGTKMCILPVAYITLKCGLSPISVFVVALLFELFSFFFSIIVCDRLKLFSKTSYFNNVLIRVISVLFFSTLGLLLLTHYYLPSTFVSVLIISLFSIIWTLINIWLIGLSSDEKYFILEIIRRLLKKNKDYFTN